MYNGGMTKIFEIRNLRVEYPVKTAFGGIKGYVKAVNDVTLSVEEGEIFGLAGESGCGKSTIGKSMLKLLKPTSGKILYKGENIDEIKDYSKIAQMIFQNPYAALTPSMTVFDFLKEPLLVHGVRDKKEINRRIEEVCELTGVDKGSLRLYPHEFSGGQRQRIAIAAAIIQKPKFIVADEPVSALDVSIRAQIINLLKDLKNELGLTMLFISHDLSVIRNLCDKTAVLYCGKVVEEGLNSEIFENPLHPYTRMLIKAAPKISREKKTFEEYEGEMPSPLDLPEGCAFESSCPYRRRACLEKGLQNISVTPTHSVKCRIYEGLKKKGS